MEDRLNCDSEDHFPGVHFSWAGRLDRDQVGRYALAGHLREVHFSWVGRLDHHLGDHRQEVHPSWVGRQSAMDREGLHETVRLDRPLMDLGGRLHVKEVSLLVLPHRLRIELHSEDILNLIPLLARHILRKRTFLHQIHRFEERCHHQFFRLRHPST